MSLKPKHGNRLGKLVTPLGGDVLLLSTFHGHEALSELYDYSVEAISDQEDLNFDDVIGSNCTLEFTTLFGEMRHFDGVCTHTRSLGAGEGGFKYSLTLRPWLWLLGNRVNQKIFAEKDVLQIVSEVFADYGSTANFESRLSGSYPTLEYTVQYRETDLNFVLRLLAHFGISFFFEHSDGQHKLILGDGLIAYNNVTGDGGNREYYPDAHQNRREKEHLGTWVPERRFTSGKFETLDYNFKKPSSDLKGKEKGDNAHTHGSLEVFDYPTKHLEKSDGQDIAKIRRKMFGADDGHHVATGNCLTISPGFLVTLKNHPVKHLNEEYLTISSSHTFVAESYSSGSAGSQGEAYTGSYDFISSSKDFAPRMDHSSPSVQGAQTAKVVGEGEIDCDEHGRILVLFHWDREKTYSMRCRVAQMWAGKSWGSMYIPRVGMEVVVEFVDGDPDKPLVIGTVYNGENKAPFDLPGQKNIAGFKSNSTKGGGGYNELVFDDTKSNELVRLHAQFDMETKVLNDERRNVDVDRKSKIGKHDVLEVGQTLTIEAGKKITLKVGKSTIVMDGTSIEMKSQNIKVQAGMELETKSGLNAEHKAGAVMNIKSPLVKIN